MKKHLWYRGLVAAAISGAAGGILTGLASIGISPETFNLQDDLHRLLDWAHHAGVELQGLEAGPTRLDDVFRAIGRN